MGGGLSLRLAFVGLLALLASADAGSRRSVRQQREEQLESELADLTPEAGPEPDKPSAAAEIRTRNQATREARLGRRDALAPGTPAEPPTRELSPAAEARARTQATREARQQHRQAMAEGGSDETAAQVRARSQAAREAREKRRSEVTAELAAIKATRVVHAAKRGADAAQINADAKNPATAGAKSEAGAGEVDTDGTERYRERRATQKTRKLAEVKERMHKQRAERQLKAQERANKRRTKHKERKAKLHSPFHREP